MYVAKNHAINTGKELPSSDMGCMKRVALG